MIAPAFVHHQRSGATSARHINEDALATAFLPNVSTFPLPDPALAVLARTAASWFAPTLATAIHLSAEHGRIRVAGHVCNARPLAYLKIALLRLPGVVGLDMTVTVEATTDPLRAENMALQRHHVG